MPTQTSRKVLDIGCNAGQVLATVDLKPGDLVAGVDIDLNALRLGKQRYPDIHFICAAGEHLPLRGDFDLVVSGVAFPYMDIPQVLQEINRITKPGARVRLTLHHISFTWSEITQSLRAFHLQNVLFRGYVILNGLALHFTGRNFRFPLQRKYCESFQTKGGITRALAAAGFGDIRISLDKQLLVTAKKNAPVPD